MPTNEERREVARKLRETSDDITDWGDSNPYWYIMKCVYGDVQIHDDNEFFYRLSSLIEPEPERTCHMIDNGCELCCSECDRRHQYDDDPNYCMGCGAKVVDE